MFSRFPCPALVLTPPSLLVASEGAGRNRALWCRVCKLQEGGGAHVLPAGTHGSLRPEKYWERGLRA